MTILQNEKFLIQAYGAYYAQITKQTTEEVLSALISNQKNVSFKDFLHVESEEVVRLIGMFYNIFNKGPQCEFPQTPVGKALATFMPYTVRTNFFHISSLEDQALALKFFYPQAPLPEVPHFSIFPGLRETFVYGQNFEGVHLRSGPIARGGIRWSSRTDYREEALQLLLTQNLKNTIVVPTGAKGTFFLRQDNQNPLLAKKCYEQYVQSLLSITDNYIDQKIVHPQGVPVRDEEDAYLVVAADKGTGTFSNYANALSLKKDYWLGDAMASGGNHGYDHKKLGITARGVWKSVQHHMEFLNMDPEAPLTVVGVGDMSGDLFGNGMLLNKNLKLIGAFNHSHIFIDPCPMIEKSYQERKRLFQLPGSSWADYDINVVSQGGGIFSRKETHLFVSQEIQALLQLEGPRITPHGLIRKLLTLSVDLLWLGGIGTYIKGSEETNKEVEDEENDAVRVDGHEVKARMIGEGANLGSTQKGRIAYALSGGCLNTDAIDNSAGVDCSDREVNLKILFAPLIKNGQLSLEKRNMILQSITEPICQSILEDNIWQNTIISLMDKNQQSPQERSRMRRFLVKISEDETLLKDGQGILKPEEYDTISVNRFLTRPELAILLAYSKIAIRQCVRGHPALRHAVWHQKVLCYFPKKIQDTFSSLVELHLLYDSLQEMIVANFLVHLLGPFFFYEENLFPSVENGVSRFLKSYENIQSKINFQTPYGLLGKEKQMLSALKDISQGCYQMFYANAID